jgi:hypothetical protein
MAKIEIKLDESTLPQDEQEVRFDTTHYGTDLIGVYSKEDQLFYIDSKKFYSAWMVDFWEPLNNEQCPPTN